MKEDAPPPVDERHDGTVTYGDGMDWWVALLVTLVSGVIYTMTAGRAAPFWDCGEFMACSYILGIPHPPGAALFVMLGRVVSILPFGDIALRLNLFSSYSSAIAIGFTALGLARVIRRLHGREKNFTDRMVVYGGTVVGALSAAFGSTYWFNAVEAEVYGLTLLLIAILIWLSLLWIERARTPEGNRILLLQTYLLFLGATNHMQSFLPVVPLFLLIFLIDRSRLRSPVFWIIFLLLTTVVHSTQFFLFGTPIACAVAFLISWLDASPDRKKIYALAGWFFFTAILGYTLYAYVPIRSANQPAIDENNPENWTNFKMFLERKQYSEKSMIELMFTRKGTWSNQFGDFHRIGFWYHLKNQWLPHSPAYLLVPLFSLFALWAMWKRDRKIGLYFLMSLLLFTVAMTLYLNFSDGTKGVKLEVRDRDYFYTPGYFLIAWLLGIGLSAFLSKLRYSRMAGRETAVQVIAILALVIPIRTASAHYFEHDRSRFFVAEDLAYNILAGLEENAILFTGGDNDTFPLWYMQEVRDFRKDVRIVNLSLINTPWYILQLKHREPMVPIPLQDEEIQNLRGYYNSDGTVTTIKDIVLPKIIRECIGKRPLYFAITVTTDDRHIVRDKLIQEGMVMKIDPSVDQESINVHAMEKNFGEGGYRFRGLADPTVYKDNDTVRLMTNYNACLYNLAQLFQRSGDKEKAKKYTDMIYSFPHDNLAGHRMLAILAEGDADWERALRHMERCYEIDPDDPLNIVKMADYLDVTGRKEEAIQTALLAREKFPDDRMVLGTLASVLRGSDREGELVDHLEQWVARHPDDERMKEALKTMRRLPAAVDSAP
ncbi:MAG: DUF2723 domain-containing protein [Candidatus Eisenbacteria bacterium]|nr:DUF2723 domain-containing protein [Candidatus Eisenbacteria bacterium]